VVVAWRQLDDAVAEPNVFRPLARGGKKNLRRRRVAVLLEKMVLHFPDTVQPELVRELDLLERVVQQLLLRTFGVRSRQLVLVEQPEAHAATIAPPVWRRSQWQRDARHSR